MRRSLVPIPEAADRFIAATPFPVGSLHGRLAEFVTRESGSRVAPGAIAAIRVPDWLRMRISIVNAEGRSVAQGRNLDELRATARAASRAKSAAL